MTKTPTTPSRQLLAIGIGLSLFAPVPRADGLDQPSTTAWTFSEQSAAVGLDYLHSYDTDVFNGENVIVSGGLAIGDINGDGWDDIFAVTAYTDDEGVNSNPDKLFISQADGTFVESASSWGLNPGDRISAGPLIADFDGDGLNDLAIGGVDDFDGSGDDFFHLYLNTGSTTFSDATTASNVPVDAWVMSMAAGDFDRDGDLDLFHTRWLDVNTVLLMQNNGAAQFTDITATHLTGTTPRAMFTPTFADLNGDDRIDLALSNDFGDQLGGSRYFLYSEASGKLEQQDNSVLTDENGMGSAIADYDNDGDLDWFVTSIYDSDGEPEGNWGVSGNRLYQNDGSGGFTDVTDTAGVRHGFWGWGTCFADFNNDMHLDLFHVNGFYAAEEYFEEEDEFSADPARMFINNGDGTFTEMSASLGVDDTGDGRAILCFDNDRDGDIDILVNNHLGYSQFFQNELDNPNHHLTIKLKQAAPNADAIGAKVYVTAGGVRQMRQVNAGGNAFSSQATAQHFGLADNQAVTLIEIIWPDGSSHHVSKIYPGQYVDRYIVFDKTVLNFPGILMNDGFE